jgi:hypothetical protein
MRHGLAFELKDDPQHSVRRGMLGAEVERDVLFGDRILAVHDGVPIAAADVVDAALGGHPAGTVGVTHRLSPMAARR